MNDFWTYEFVTRLITSLLGTLAFAILFRCRARHLPYASACGLFTYAIYYTASYFGASLFFAAFLCTAFTTVFSEVCARFRYAPTLVFLVPGTIPIVPGSDLYYTMRYLLEENYEKFYIHMQNALLVGIGIAGGIVSVSIIVSAWRKKMAAHH